MVCTNCGFNNDDTNNICVNCGNPLNPQPVYAENNYNEQPMYAQENAGYNFGMENGEIPAPTTEKPKDVFGIVSIILGAVGIVMAVGSCCCMIPILPWLMIVLAFVLGIAGIVLGAVAMKKAKDAGTKSTLALVGIILSGVAMLTVIGSLIVTIVSLVFVGAAGGLGIIEELLWELGLY